MNKAILCPVCLSELKVTHQEHYQDLTEHVCNPNGKPSLKDGYQCVHSGCYANEVKLTWIEDGSVFYTIPAGIKYSEVHRQMDKLTVHGIEDAVNSFNFFMNLGNKEIEKRKRRVELFNYVIDIEPKEKGWNYPEDQRFMPKRFSWKFTYWKRSKEDRNHMTMVIPTWRMVKFCLKGFHTDYDQLLSDMKMNQYKLRNCTDLIKGRSRIGDNPRDFEIVTSWILRIFYRGKVQVINVLAEANNIK